MSIKRSPAARVIDFFATAPVGEAKLVYGLVREVIRKREATNDGKVAEPVANRKRCIKRTNTKAPTDVAAIATAPQVV